MNVAPVPQPVLERLSRLYIQCAEWEKAGRDSFTSREAARYLVTSAATVRKDLHWIGSDHPGAGYSTTQTRHLLQQVLFFDHEPPAKACLVGLGDLGLAIWADQKTRANGWKIVAGFDSRRNRLEQLDLDLSLYQSTDITTVVRRENISLAILTVDVGEAQKMTDRLLLGGIKAILNLSPILVRVPRPVLLTQVAVDFELANFQALLKGPHPTPPPML